MMKKMSLIEREPLAVLGAVGVVVTALIHLLVVFGFDVNPEREKAITGLVDAVGLLVILFIGRRSVTANRKVVSRTTTTGEVVAGDAAAAPTGSLVPIVADPLTGEPVPVVAVRPALLADESLPEAA